MNEFIFEFKFFDTQGIRESLSSSNLAFNRKHKIEDTVWIEDKAGKLHKLKYRIIIEDQENE